MFDIDYFKIYNETMGIWREMSFYKQSLRL